MAVAKLDQNSRPTLTAVSSSDPTVIVPLYADPVTHRLLTDTAAGSGTVTSVSVVSANGFAGTVANATTTPAITLSTTITGIIKGNGTAISAATDGTDYLSSSTGVLLSNVTTTATASKVVQRDSNANIFINNDIEGYQTIATAGGTTVFTAGSPYNTYFTGSSNQTVTLPDATTLALGFDFRIHNNSTGAVTVKDNGGTTVWIIAAGTQGIVTCTNIGTAAGSWDTEYLGVVAGIGKKVTINNTLTFQGTDNTTFTFPSSTGTVTVLGNTTTGTGSTIVLSTSPTLVTPILGVATATSINKVALTAPATSATLTIADGKTLTVNNYLTLAGTDSTTMTFPTTSATIARTDAAQTFTGTQTFSQVVTTANAITASANAATIPVTSRHNIVTNNSAATLTITLTTTSAVNMQTCVVQILDATAVAQTISWVNTENSTVSVPTTSNGSTTLPLTVGFMYNAATSKWRCIASA